MLCYFIQLPFGQMQVFKLLQKILFLQAPSNTILIKNYLVEMNNDGHMFIYHVFERQFQTYDMET